MCLRVTSVRPCMTFLSILASLLTMMICGEVSPRRRSASSCSFYRRTTLYDLMPVTHFWDASVTSSLHSASEKSWTVWSGMSASDLMNASSSEEADVCVGWETHS